MQINYERAALQEGLSGFAKIMRELKVGDKLLINKEMWIQSGDTVYCPSNLVQQQCVGDSTWIFDTNNELTIGATSFFLILFKGLQLSFTRSLDCMGRNIESTTAYFRKQDYSTSVPSDCRRVVYLEYDVIQAAV